MSAPPAGEPKPEPQLSFSSSPTLLDPKVTLTAKYDFVWMDNTNGAGRLLCVDGIREITPLGGNLFVMKQQQRPEKPEEVTVTLWTADGKKWVAKWEEVKP